MSEIRKINPNDLLFSCKINRPGAFKKLINEMSTFTTIFEFNVTDIGIQFLHEELSTEGFSCGKLPKENFGNDWFLFFPPIISSVSQSETIIYPSKHFLSDPHHVTLEHLNDRTNAVCLLIVQFSRRFALRCICENLHSHKSRI